jgi:ABC-type phosphate/phosphonate transport system substrate-binding protein
MQRASFGLVVSPKSDTLARFDALAGWMREHAGVDLERRPAATYKDLAASVREGTSDIAWLPPVAYAWLAEAVTPIGSIAREGRTSYAAALVVGDASPIGARADLAQVRAGWVDPWSAAGYVVPRLELARAGVRPSHAFRSETFYGSHRDALAALDRDECDVVGTYEGAWADLGSRVRPIATFGSIPTDVIAVRRNLGPVEYETVAGAFREACRDPAARELVRAVFGGDELREGVEPGHEALRRAYETGIASGLFD